MIKLKGDDFLVVLFCLVVVCRGLLLKDFYLFGGGILVKDIDNIIMIKVKSYFF